MPLAQENCSSGPEFYARREPSASPFWRIVDAHYAEFERVYPQRYGRYELEVGSLKFEVGSSWFEEVENYKRSKRWTRKVTRIYMSGKRA